MNAGLRVPGSSPRIFLSQDTALTSHLFHKLVRDALKGRHRLPSRPARARPRFWVTSVSPRRSAAPSGVGRCSTRSKLTPPFSLLSAVFLCSCWGILGTCAACISADSTTTNANAVSVVADYNCSFPPPPSPSLLLTTPPPPPPSLRKPLHRRRPRHRHRHRRRRRIHLLPLPHPHRLHLLRLQVHLDPQNRHLHRHDPELGHRVRRRESRCREWSPLERERDGECEWVGGKRCGHEGGGSGKEWDSWGGCWGGVGRGRGVGAGRLGTGWAGPRAHVLFLVLSVRRNLLTISLIGTLRSSPSSRFVSDCGLVRSTGAGFRGATA